MRRIVATLALLAAASLVVFGQAAGGSGSSYEVRAIFDNGNFLVPGEEVRVAGAHVGSIDSVDVTAPGDWANQSCLTAPKSSTCATPGKAVVVLNITEAGFQDFRQDASCLIRPQSLLGEKYVDCQPTQPRPPGSQPPPPLKVIPSDQPGAGQHFLPLENNGQEVDLDLINNIMRQPYADRFRLILNELGAGLAARGNTLDAIIKRADPALQQTDRVLAVLASQNHQLAGLAKNSDTILTPLVRERSHLAGFINNSNIAAQATAERSAALESGLQKFPAALHQLRLTMTKLRAFSEQATPVFSEFRSGAPAIARATRALGPFAQAAKPSLITLGTAAQESQQPLVNSTPILRKVGKLAKKSAPGAESLDSLLKSLRKTDGTKFLMHFIYNATGVVNGYDQYGHFLRALLTIPSGCTTLVTTITEGCQALWSQSNQASTKAASQKMLAASSSGLAKAIAQAKAQGPSGTGGTAAGTGATAPAGGGSTAVQPGQPLDAQGQPPAGTTTTTPSTSGGQPRAPSLSAARDLLDTVLGPRHRSHRGKRQ
jgi:phospholipid/cholesterol/gamma-HCH transport system substrate-binding protein